MAAITVFWTASSFLSFASVREASSVPKFEDFAWGPSTAATPGGITENSGYGYVRHLGDECESTCDTIFANYLILGVENERFRAAYVAFSGRSNFDKVTKSFLERYGEPDKSGSAPDNRYWFGEDLNVHLQYQTGTDEGILALTYQEA